MFAEGICNVERKNIKKFFSWDLKKLNFVYVLHHKVFKANTLRSAQFTTLFRWLMEQAAP